MVAYQGNVDFSFEGGGASKFIKKALTGEGLPLMRCQGQGDVFLAERAYDVHLLNLNNSGCRSAARTCWRSPRASTGTSSG